MGQKGISRHSISEGSGLITNKEINVGIASTVG